MNQNGDIANTLFAYIRKQLAAGAPTTLTLDTLLFREGHLDSTAMLDLILWIEDKFQVTIENEELTPENFATPRNIVEFIERKSGPALEADAAASLGNTAPVVGD